MPDACQTPTMTDREAREIVERIVRQWGRGDVYEALDEVHRVFARGFRAPPPPKTPEELLAEAEADLEEAEREAERARKALDALVVPRG